jgi:membrane-associated protein
VFDVLIHLDRYLNEWAHSMGGWFYVLLFLVMFAETGLVVTPFLPGDSLLLAIGALSKPADAPIDMWTAVGVMTAGAILGDSTNYWIGRYVGPRVFSSDKSRLLNKKHLLKAEAFYERHGGKTIILCRFLAVIRTFAPFVAGVGRMSYPRFLGFSVLGTLLWVPVFVILGRTLVDLIGAENIHWVVLGIILFAVVPPTVSRLRERAAARRAAGPNDRS